MKDVEEKKIILNDGTEVPYGLLVWSTGVGPSAIIQSLDLPKAPGGRLFLLLNIVALIFFLLLKHKKLFLSLLVPILFGDIRLRLNFPL